MKKITLLMLIALITITTHGQNKLLSSIRESYYNNTWSKDYGTNYEYDSKNNLIAETELRWDSSTSTWKISSKTKYTYNSSNMVTEEIEQDWNSTNNTLENDYKGIKIYNDGKLTEMLDYYWENASWVLDSKFEITYNSNNLPISYIYSELGDTQLVPEERYTITYNANNKILSTISEAWNGTQWANSEKTLYTYNAQNKITSQKSADWDEFNSNWAANGNQTEYEWDATGNKTSETDYYKDSRGNISRYKDEYTYDTFNLMSSFAHPFKDKTGLDYFEEGGVPYINKLLTETGNDGTSRTVYNYNSALTLGNETLEIAAKRIKIYPNPTVDFLNIQNESNTSMDKITVTDLTGKKVLEANKVNSLDVQNLAKGMYILEVFLGENKETRRFIKE